MKRKKNLRGKFKNELILSIVLTVLTSSNKNSHLLINMYKYT